MATAANNHQIGGNHYKGGDYQHWDWVVQNKIGYLEGQVTKYLSRWQAKNGCEDLEKAKHYADKLTEVIVQGLYPLQEARAVSGISRIAHQYHLTGDELLIFKTLAEYSTLEEVFWVQSKLQKMLEGIHG